MYKILISGGTGFIGSNIIEYLLENGYEIASLKRNRSNLWRCQDFNKKINWIESDNFSNMRDEIHKFHPEIFIHSAWNGVKANDRDNWFEQGENIYYLTMIMEIIKEFPLQKMIALGSQAEYGSYNGAIDESYNCIPDTAYGANKLCALNLTKAFCLKYSIKWYWLRLFSVFGPKEDKDWLISATINNLLKNREMKLTSCEQKYDYMYIKDISRGILNIIEDVSNNSGIYNFSTGNSIVLRDLLTIIENIIAPGKNLLDFGAIPYRSNQIMHMQGISKRFFSSFNFKLKYDIIKGLEETINYYRGGNSHEHKQ